MVFPKRKLFNLKIKLLRKGAGNLSRAHEIKYATCHHHDVTVGSSLSNFAL